MAFFDHKGCSKFSFFKTTPPHDAIGKNISRILPKAKSQKAKEIEKKIQEKIKKSRTFLKNHSVNISRIKSGNKPGNMIWPWSGGKKPSLESFQKK